jgi:hypothetical protein
MSTRTSECEICKTNFELELVGFSLWNKKKNPSLYECPGCSQKHYIRETEWIKSLTWNGVKISKRHNHIKINTDYKAFNVDLNANEVYRILNNKNIKHLHHTNTVTTSKTFLEYGALLSREYVQVGNLFQTIQDSDDKDVELGINDYVFLDGKDLGEYFSRPNHYGPILFKLKLELLLSDEINTVRISRKNPVHWNSKDGLNDKYHNSLQEFEKEYLSGNKLSDGGTMFMITSVNGKLDFGEYLDEVCVDNPNLILSDKTKLITKISDFLNPDLQKFGKNLIVLNRFRLLYNIMYKFKLKKYKKFFSTQRT